ncbi:serine metalloprotease precursor [Aeromonas caviae]|nr:serine metalloprotease precursor [Aeromonas caviae]GKR20633.1 serine metalloprotease precursor [Aeromonas caviae]GKR25078.1 serine metalloprotease precursor [Aeromonas caviae]GKR29429.1 serine metalloprotease precursor [Aeromonas caviae]GKR33752.1 serine metalloprotease precursor [Aeromonas caviae]
MSNGMDVITVENVADAQAVAEMMQASGLVEYAYPDVEVKATPLVESKGYTASKATGDYNDPSFAEQVHFLPRSEQFKGASDILNAQTQVTIPKTQIGVAVLDTGYYPHPDINFNVAAGYDFINRDADALDKFGSCTDGHGLSVAGIISATTNNNLNIAGIASNVQTVPVKVIASGCGEKGGSLSDLIDALNWVGGVSVAGVPAYNGPKINVVNMSLGVDNTACIAPLQDAVNNLNAKGISVVASAGNEMAASNANAPANCAGVINVGSVNVQSGMIADVSNRGSRVDIGASGEGVPTLVEFTDQTVYFGGTSAAAPVVSGVLALAYSNVDMNSSEQNIGLVNTVKKLLQTTASPMGSEAQACTDASTVSDDCFNGGIIDANKFVKAFTLLAESKIERPYAMKTEGSCESNRQNDVMKGAANLCQSLALKLADTPQSTGISSIKLYKGADMNSLTEVATSKVSSMVIDSNADINAKYAVSYCDDSADDATCSTPIAVINRGNMDCGGIN